MCFTESIVVLNGHTLSQVAYDFTAMQLELALKSMNTWWTGQRSSCVFVRVGLCARVYTFCSAQPLFSAGSWAQSAFTDITDHHEWLFKTMQLLHSKTWFSYLTVSVRWRSMGGFFCLLEILLILEISGKLQSGFFFFFSFLEELQKVWVRFNLRHSYPHSI